MSPIDFVQLFSRADQPEHTSNGDTNNGPALPPGECDCDMLRVDVEAVNEKSIEDFDKIADLLGADRSVDGILAATGALKARAERSEATLRSIAACLQAGGSLANYNTDRYGFTVTPAVPAQPAKVEWKNVE